MNDKKLTLLGILGFFVAVLVGVTIAKGIVLNVDGASRYF